MHGMPIRRAYLLCRSARGRPEAYTGTRARGRKPLPKKFRCRSTTFAGSNPARRNPVAKWLRRVPFKNKFRALAAHLDHKKTSARAGGRVRPLPRRSRKRALLNEDTAAANRKPNLPLSRRRRSICDRAFLTGCFRIFLSSERGHIKEEDHEDHHRRRTQGLSVPERGIC